MAQAAMKVRNKVGSKLLWWGVLGGGIAWAVQLTVGYGLEEIACSSGTKGTHILGMSVPSLIYILSAAAAAFTLVAIAICIAAMRRAGGSEDHRDQRVVFMGITGLAANLLFLAIIGFGAIAPIYLGSCH